MSLIKFKDALLEQMPELDNTTPVFKFLQEYIETEQKIYKARRIYETEKILVKRIGNKIIGSYDDKGFYNVCDVYNIQLKSNDNYNLKSISSIINSKFINFYYDTKFKSVKIQRPNFI